MNRLLRCTNCDEIFCESAFDRWPEYEPVPDSSLESFKVVEKNDLEEFLKRHGGHRLEELKPLESDCVSDKGYLEPVKASYFKATNGREDFVIKKYRRDVAAPLTYKLIHSDFSLRCVRIVIRSEEIERQMKRECPGLPEEKIRDFLRAYQEIAQKADVKTLERASAESSHPLHIHFRMSSFIRALLMKNLRTVFSEDEYALVRDFIDRNRDETFFLLVGVHEIRWTDLAEPAKEVESFAFPLQGNVLKR